MTMVLASLARTSCLLVGRTQTLPQVEAMRCRRITQMLRSHQQEWRGSVPGFRKRKAGMCTQSRTSSIGLMGHGTTPWGSLFVARSWLTHMHSVRKRLHGTHCADHAIGGKTPAANLWTDGYLKKKECHVDKPSPWISTVCLCQWRVNSKSGQCLANRLNALLRFKIRWYDVLVSCMVLCKINLLGWFVHMFFLQILESR